MKDNSWEQYGKENPYFAVCTDPRYKTDNLNEAALQEFFESGEGDVKTVLSQINDYFSNANINSFKNVLDFGCGTGRILIPFAQRFEHVLGIDISTGMLKEAAKNISDRGLNNVSLIQSEDINTIEFKDSFDLVHTYIVLQHIPVDMGYKIIDKLISLIRKDGFGMIHFTYANPLSPYREKKMRFKAKHWWYYQLSNLLKGRKANTPLMQMNNYDLKVVFEILKKYHLRQVSIDFTDHGGYLGLKLYIKK